MIIYDDAINLIKKNPYNLGNIPVDLIDLRLVRFVRRYHIGTGAWAVEAYTPKKLKNDAGIWIDSIINFPFEDIPLDKSSK